MSMIQPQFLALPWRASAALLLCGGLLLSAGPVSALEREWHAPGTAAKGVARRGPQGGVMLRGHALQSDGAGQLSGASAAAFKGPQGAQGARSGQFERQADGSLSHQSAAQASGAAGSLQTQSSLQRQGEGPISGQRSTTATGAQGNTYQGSTSYTQGQGVSHSASCQDASGQSIPCPR